MIILEQFAHDYSQYIYSMMKYKNLEWGSENEFQTEKKDFKGRSDDCPFSPF